MRKIFTIIAMMMLWTVSLFAQVPQKMAYQAVVRDADGKVITNQELGVQVSILQGSVDGASVYSESHTTTSTSAGAINIEIGGGKTSDDFSTIDWSKGPYFIQSTTEVNGKSVTVTSQLLSVPYAQFAKRVDEEFLLSYITKVLVDSGLVYDYSIPEPLKPTKEDGVLQGKFSVSDTTQVSFSMGNLQYQASTDTWRFAENQYDIIGQDNLYVSATNEHWIDCFGYGTSGYNDMYPYMTSLDPEDYPDLDISGTNYDWGVYNAISNGGGEKGMWRTLSHEEWDYVISLRPMAKKYRSPGTVCGILGLILLPDDFPFPPTIAFEPMAGNFTTNVYDANKWGKLESYGAVFLPVSTRNCNFCLNSESYYWSCTNSSNYGSYALHFEEDVVKTATDVKKYLAFPVRLVK